MADRENKATVRDAAMEDAFRQGFAEGTLESMTSMIVYELKSSFDGTDLNQVQFTDLEAALAEARNLLLNGGGVSIVINAIAVPVTRPSEPVAVAAGEDPDIEDAEVVEDSPNGA